MADDYREPIGDVLGSLVKVRLDRVAKQSLLKCDDMFHFLDFNLILFPLFKGGLHVTFGHFYFVI